MCFYGACGLFDLLLGLTETCSNLFSVCLSSFFFSLHRMFSLKKNPWSTLVGLKRNDVKNLYKSLFSMVNLLYISTAEKKKYIYILGERRRNKG